MSSDLLARFKASIEGFSDGDVARESGLSDEQVRMVRTGETKSLRAKSIPKAEKWLRFRAAPPKVDAALARQAHDLLSRALGLTPATASPKGKERLVRAASGEGGATTAPSKARKV